MSTYYMAPCGYRRMHRYQPTGFNGGRRLPIDVRVDDEAYEITAEVPGLTADDLKIEILEDIITLRAEIETEEGDEHVLLRERGPVSFERRLRLPDALDIEGAEAKIENGLLWLRLPKAEEARPKTITVKA
ncbi:MAG: Hsp20/alpha crystallin family protein [Anaerolineales bacterium]|nr:Hsp20/alpha crystallin family protein [Anaerolineales bacterium]